MTCSKRKVPQLQRLQHHTKTVNTFRKLAHTKVNMTNIYEKNAWNLFWKKKKKSIKMAKKQVLLKHEQH